MHATQTHYRVTIRFHTAIFTIAEDAKFSVGVIVFPHPKLPVIRFHTFGRVQPFQYHAVGVGVEYAPGVRVHRTG